MKKFSSLVLLAACTSAAAFAPVKQPRASLMRRFVVKDPTEKVEAPQMVEKPSQQIEVDSTEVKKSTPEPVATDARDQIEPGRYDSLTYSKALPFFERPPKLDGSHAGDNGFDPCGLSEIYDLYYMQECELRHGRLAMLAVAGWPLSEMLAPDFMLQDGCAPSVLNGFNPISASAVLAAFSAFGLFEYKTALRRTAGTKLGDKHLHDMEKVWKHGVAGDYDFDPLNLYSTLGDDASGRKAIREVEISQGRLAMLGITYFAFWESLTGKPIVEDNLFFQPNAILPLAAVSYFIWSQFYQISDVRKYPIRIEYTKDGEEMLRGLKRSVSGQQE